MIARFIQTGPQASKNQYIRSDANETLLFIGAILFWAAALPIASVFFAVAALWDRVGVPPRRRQSVPWGGVLRYYQVEEAGRRIRTGAQKYHCIAGSRNVIRRD